MYAEPVFYTLTQSLGNILRIKYVVIPMNRLVLILLYIPFLLGHSSCTQQSAANASISPSEQSTSGTLLARLSNQTGQTERFAKLNGYSTEISIQIDMRIPDTKFRFFVVDLKKDSILKRGLVTHGHCGSFGVGDPKFSNVPGSNCSSLGRFSVGKKYVGKFGTAYKLHGLDSSNSAAFERFIVLHSHSCVPDTESWGWICQSEGCPTISPKMLKEIQPIIDKQKKPVLLNIFY